MSNPRTGHAAIDRLGHAADIPAFIPISAFP
jgi:hypothetical protein